MRSVSRPLVCFAAATLIGSASAANPLKTPDDTRALCDDAVKALAQSKIRQSFALLKPHWPLPAEEIDNLSYQTESQLKMVASRFGAPTGTDFVGSKSAGQSLIRHVYLAKFERHAIRYTCTFYKPGATWLVNSIQWDDKVGSLLD